MGESSLAHLADAGVGSTDLHGTVKHLHLSRTVLPQSTTGDGVPVGDKRTGCPGRLPGG